MPKPYVIRKLRHALRARKILRTLRPRKITVDLLRIGELGDGGYLLPADFEGIEAVFSPGVGGTASFEHYMLDLGIPCHLLDGSVPSAPIEHNLLRFRQTYLGKENTGDAISLGDWIKDHDGDGDLLLQMDIEGAEWPILESIDSGLLRRFRIIVIEIHGLAAKLSKYSGLYALRKAVENLAKTHVPVHFHPNNCCGSKQIFGMTVPDVVEITLVRKDRSYLRQKYARLPHPLDELNVSNHPPLPSPW